MGVAAMSKMATRKNAFCKAIDLIFLFVYINYLLNRIIKIDSK